MPKKSSPTTTSKPSTPITANKGNEKVVSEAAFLKALDKKKAAAKAVAKEKKSDGFLDDSEIIKKLGISGGGRLSTSAAISKIVMFFAKKDANRPAYRFQFVLKSDNPKINGMQLSKQHILEEQLRKVDNEVFRTVEDVWRDIFFNFQGLGDDTAEWGDNPGKYVTEALKRHTKEKTQFALSMSTFDRADGSEGVNYRFNNPLNDDDDEEEENDSDGAESDTDEPFVGKDWVHGWIEFEGEDDDGEAVTVRAKVTKFNSKTNTFNAVESDGGEWENLDVDTCTWSDDQDEE